jgi:hypothetical protein
MREKWMATAVRLLLFALLFAQHGPTATSWATDDANGSAAVSQSAAAEHESVVDNFFAAYFEQPCCVRPRHVRHHKNHVRELSCGRMYYRTFHLDENRDTLYVGAMDHVYRLNLSNISHSSCKVRKNC